MNHRTALYSSLYELNLNVIVSGNTVNVDIFALYLFSLNSRFLNVREKIYTVKITIIID